MFYHSHDLDNLIAQLFDFRQNIQSEMREGMDFFLYARHTDMALVDSNTFVCPLGSFVFPFVVVQWDVDSVERFVLILFGEVYPGWNSVFIVAGGKLNLNFQG